MVQAGPAAGGRLAALRVGSLPAAETATCDGIQYEHVELDAEGGFRVWMNNPGNLPASPWDLVVRRWERLREARPMAVRWPAVEAIPGGRVLYDSGLAPQRLPLHHVDGSEGLRVLNVPGTRYGRPQTPRWFLLGGDGPGAPCAAPAGWSPAVPATTGFTVAEHLRSTWRAG